MRPRQPGRYLLPGALSLLSLLLLLTACGQDGPQLQGSSSPAGFAATLSQPELSVMRGEAITLELTLTPEEGFNGNIALLLEGAPPGVTLRTTDLQLTGTSPVRRQLLIEVGENVTPAGYALTLRARTGTVHAILPLTLEVRLPPGAAAPQFKANRTGLPESGGEITLSWNAPADTGNTLSVTPADDVRIDGQPHAGPVTFPAGTASAVLTLPANPGGDIRPLGYTLTLSAQGAAGTKPASETIGVAVGGTGSGSLAVVIEGLPEGLDGTVSISGPGFEQTLNSTAVLTGLTPGPYEVSPAPVGSTVTYGSGPARVSVEAASTASITVRYGPHAPEITAFNADTLTLGPAGGKLALDWAASSAATYTLKATPAAGVGGLPAGTTSDTSITVTLPPNDSLDGRNDYTFTLGASGAASLPDATAELTVSVGPLSSGEINLQVSGITTETSQPPRVSIRAADDTAVTVQTLDGSYRLQGISPGSYQLTAPAYTDEHGNGYAAGLEPGAAFTVGSGEAVTAEVHYTTPTGALLVNPRGLPGGSTAQFELGGPAALTLEATGVPALLAPGNYTLTPLAINAGDDFTYVTAALSASVTQGKLTLIEASYQPSAGAIDLALQFPGGLQVPATTGITISCNEGEPRAVEPPVIPFISGDCTISAKAVDLNGVAYRPSPDSYSLNVEPGQRQAVSIRYEPEPPLIESFTASPASLGTAGGQVELSWTGRNAASYELSAPAGVTLPAGSTGTSATARLPANTNTTPQDYILTLRAHGAGSTGSTGQDTVITVDAGAGTLELTISGLPAGVDGDVVIDPDDSRIRMLQTGTLILPAGEYRIQAAAVDVDGATYQADTTGTDTGELVTIEGGATRRVAVTYNQEFGDY